MCETMRGLTFILLLLCSFARADVCTLANFTLRQAEQIALQKNKDICTLCQLYEAAKEGKYNAFSKWLPEISLSSSGYKTQNRQPNTGSRSAFISQLELVQRIVSTNTYYDLRIAGLITENAKLLLDALMIDVLYEVRATYYRIILDYQNIATAKTNIEILGQLAVRMESDYKRGTSILLNVNQSKVAIANATSIYYQAIRDLEVDIDNLANLMGYIPGQVKLEFASIEIPILQIPELSTKVQSVTQIFADKQAQGSIYKPGFVKEEESVMKNLFTHAEINNYEMTALQLRPDLKSKCKEWKIAQERVNKELGTYWPELNFEYNYGGYPTYTDFFPSSNLFNQHFYWAAGFRFPGFSTTGAGGLTAPTRPVLSGTQSCAN